MKSGICDISVARFCEDRSWLLDPDSQISSEHGIDIWHGGGKKKIWSPWPNPGGREMKCWPGCRFKFIEQRYFTFAVKIVAIQSRKPALSLAGSVCGPSRDVYIRRFYIRGLIYHRFSPQRSNRMNPKVLLSCCCCCCRTQRVRLPVPRVFLWPSFKGGERIPRLGRSCWNCLERRSQLFEKEFGTSFQFCSQVVIDDLSFMLWDWWVCVCVFYSIVTYCNFFRFKKFNGKSRIISKIFVMIFL